MTDQLPSGFVLDEEPPKGFVVQDPPTRFQKYMSGANRTYRSLAGLPVDLVNALTSYNAPGNNWPSLPRADNPVLGSQMIGQGMQALGVDLNQPRDIWGMLGEYTAPAPFSGALNAVKAPTVGPMARVATKALGPTVGPVVGQVAREGVAGTAAAIGGAAGQQIGEKLGGDPVPWEMLGSLAPSALATFAGAIPKLAVRGTDPTRMQTRIGELDAQGLPVTAALASDRPWLTSQEAKLAASPGGFGVYREVGRQADAAFDASQQRIVGGASDSIDAAGTVAKGGTFPTGTGGIFGKGGYLDRWKATKTSLYNALDAKIGSRTPTVSPNTEQFFRGYTAIDPNSPALSAGAKNSTISGWAQRYLSDIQGNQSTLANAPATLPYERLKQLRSEVGAQLEVTDPSVLNSVDRASMKSLYAAISEDMKAAAAQNGATAEFTKANRFYHQGADRIDTWLENLNNKVRPEDFWKATVGDSPKSATQLRAYKQMLSPDEWDYMVETVSNRWGKITPGQETIGHQFQLNKWYTNWNSTPTEVRDVLFGKKGTPKRDAAELMAKNLDKYREQNQVLFNSSGTAGLGLASSAQFGAIGSVGTTVLGWLTGAIKTPTDFAIAAGAGTAAGVGMGSAGSYGLAKLTTNDKFARWLAKGMEMPGERLPAHLMRLYSISKNDESLKGDAEQIIQGLDPALYARLYGK